MKKRTLVLWMLLFALVVPLAVSGQSDDPTLAPAAPAVTTPVYLPIFADCDVTTCVLSAGTWTLTGMWTFILGMEITVPDGWESLESDAGEFNLFPLDHPNDHIFMVKDIVAVTTDGTFQRVPGVPPTAEGLWTFWHDDPNLVVSEPTSTTIAGGLDAVTFTVGVSPDAQFTDPGCPVYPRCADMFTDPRYWGGPYGVGAPTAVRFYFATIRNGYRSHLFVVGLEGEDEAALERLTADAAPIIDSIRLPEEFPVW